MSDDTKGLAMQNKARKATKFRTCRAHGWLDSLSRSRRAEFFVEGGPTDGPCADLAHDVCQLWPGTDLFVPTVCEGMAEMELAWPVNVREDDRQRLAEVGA